MPIDLTGYVPQGSVVGLIMIMFVVGVVIVGIFGVISFLIWNSRRWHLKVEIKLPRSNGQIVEAEWGKGYFNPKRGVVYIKRPGRWSPAIPLKIFDPKRYLQGRDTMTVIQITPTDYRPVLPVSFLEHSVEYKNTDTGKIEMVKESVLNIECDTGHSKAWQESFDAAARTAYTFKSFFKQFEVPISIAIVLVAVFIGITALWTQMPK
jgi:hypothetical protein